MAETEVHRTARSLIANHGGKALAIAERASVNVGSLNMTDRVQFWNAVAAAIRSIEAGAV
jgi:hypothetical protein